MSKTLLTITESATYLEEKPAFVRDLVKGGEITAQDRRRPGSEVARWKIERAELDRWKRDRQVHATKPATIGGVMSIPQPSRPEVRGLLARRRAARRARQGA